MCAHPRSYVRCPSSCTGTDHMAEVVFVARLLAALTWNLANMPSSCLAPLREDQPNGPTPYTPSPVCVGVMSTGKSDKALCSAERSSRPIV